MRLRHRRDHAAVVPAPPRCRARSLPPPFRFGRLTPFTPAPKGPFTMQVAIPLFPRFTALDAIGPYEVLQLIPEIDVTFIGHQRGEVRSENGFLGITVDATFEEMAHPDIVVFPGGVGTRPLMTDERVLEWVRTAHTTSTFTTSVCTGSLVLAAAGLLTGLTATTYWS
eukprot:gene40992-64985_t